MKRPAPGPAQPTLPLDAPGPAEAVPAPCFLETQFPVAKLSKESYGERTAKQSQTLTGLGKWWGRKPLVLVRAALLGLLMPSSKDPKKDREIFLRILTMDGGGMWRRKDKLITKKELFRRLPETERKRFFTEDSTADKPRYRKGLEAHEKENLQAIVFGPMTYDEKLEYTCRPEEVDGPSEKSWDEINAHLGTSTKNLPDFVAELGRRRFGRLPRVGDPFSGGGSIPFEAARLGCEVYGGDLNPVAALLTWASLRIVGGTPEAVASVRDALRQVYDTVDKQIVACGIEQNEDGWRAEGYLYCVEARCPECGFLVPLAPAWAIGEKTRCIARLVPDGAAKRFRIEIESGVSDEAMDAARKSGTIKDSALRCPNCPDKPTPLSAVRGDELGGLRPWERQDLVPREGDVFQERLYCIRWSEPGRDGADPQRHYRAPEPEDLEREAQVLELLHERFESWQAKGILPSRKIEPGAKTDEPIRTRGWTHWQHLFNPRQLLTLGLLGEALDQLDASQEVKVGILLAIGRCADWNSRLCRWDSSAANEKGVQTFSNQALNALYNYSTRAFPSLDTTWLARISNATVRPGAVLAAADARAVTFDADVWISDPPYADAINYDELSEFFLAWYTGPLARLFPDWYTDSKRALAVKGEDHHFRKAMVDCYRTLARHMPASGLQVVMFTHQDASVWASLALILWAAGLRVTAAWCIATETDSAQKQGNYVQGTVLLVLRKQTSKEEVFLDEVYQEVESEVRRQVDSMRDLDDSGDPNFSDTDYQLAAYAAALRVLTARPIAEIDLERELSGQRPAGEISPVEALIDNAVRIACDYLVPRGIERHLWISLQPTERFYLKGLEMEGHGEHRSGVYQELARGFAVEEYQGLLFSTKANEARLRAAGEFAGKDLSAGPFAGTLVRQALFAIHRTVETDGTTEGMQWLRTELPDYWANRERLVGVLDFLVRLRLNDTMSHWRTDSEAAERLAGAVRNDHV